MSLDQEMAGRLHDAMTHFQYEHSRAVNPNPTAKWRITSALQKSIRRGYADSARFFARSLLTLDREYFYRRMAVISMEDVGAGNPQLVAMYLYASRFKTVRAKYGEYKVAEFFADQFARAIKDRNACDLLVCADWHPDYAKQRAEFFHYDPEMLAEGALGTDDEIERTIALWYLMGTSTFTSPVLPPRSGSKEWFKKVNYDLGVSELGAYISKWGASKQREGHPITIGNTIRLAAKSTGFTEDRLIKGPSIGRYPPCALDMHTREGKHAIAMLSKDIGNLYQYSKLADINKSIGIVLFRLEGHQVDRRMHYPQTPWIQKKTEESFMMSACGDIELGLQLMETVYDYMDELNEKRRYALSKTSVQVDHFDGATIPNL